MSNSVERGHKVEVKWEHCQCCCPKCEHKYSHHCPKCHHECHVEWDKCPYCDHDFDHHKKCPKCEHEWDDYY